MSTQDERRLVSAAELAQRSGLSRAYFTRLARAGIDWAYQPGGIGSKYVFDLDAFEEWFEKSRTDKCRTTCIGGKIAKAGTAVSMLTGRRKNSPSEQRVAEKLRNALKSS